MATHKENLDQVPEQIGHTRDGVFGETLKEGPNYHTVGFLGTIILTMKIQLGVLAIPSALDVLGMVPGIICLLRHRDVYSLDDAGGIMFGLPGRAVLSTAFCLCNIRTLGRITRLVWIGLPCIRAAIIIVTIAVGVQDRPWAIAAVSNLLFAFFETRGFYSIVSEMRNPQQHSAAMLTFQAGVTAMYAVIGCIIYYYYGTYVSSPALYSAAGVVKFNSYRFALPGLLVTMTIVTYIPVKFIFVHILRGSHHLTSNTPKHWLTCISEITIIAWIIASTIPVFDALVSLIGALLGPLMCIQPMGAMWRDDNWGKAATTATGTDTGQQRTKTNRWTLMVGVGWSVLLIVLGTFLMVAGTYGSLVGIVDSYSEG
ncbi:hypothetical protein BDV12DRAFT_185605 [Aspergillus spectabilis]